MITNPKQDGYIGATRGTNNTGELTALHGALVRAKELTAGTPRPQVLILSDSLLALCTPPPEPGPPAPTGPSWLATKLPSQL